MKRTGFVISGLLLAVTLSGCGSLIHSPYQRPLVEVPNQWQEQVALEKQQYGEWWRGFNDPVLEGLIEQALGRNNSLTTALLNVRRAQLQVGLANDARWPQLSSSVGASRSRDLGSSADTQRSYSFNTGVSWEADLWDRLGSLNDAAQFEANATEQDYAAARLALIGTVANLYWQIAYLNERLTASEASIDYAEQTLAFVQSQYRAGQVSQLELSEAEQSLESQRAARIALLQQRVEQRNAVAVLFNTAEPLAFEEPQSLVGAHIPEVDPGLPASLLSRRPDLQAAEWRLQRTLKNWDATRASYYPDLRLTGSIGYGSDALSQLLKNPMGAVGANISLPFLQVRRMNLDLGISEVDYQIAVTNFRQSLYQALLDVDNQLSGRRYYAEQQGMRERSLTAAKEAERIYRVRYEAGAETLQSWLRAQDTRRSAEISLSENRLNQLLNYISLAQALGGDARLPSEEGAEG